MKKLFIPLCTAAFILLGTGLVMAASDNTNHDINITVDEVAMIELNSTDAISFTIEAPALAGDPFVSNPTENNDKWLWYSSIVAGSGEARTVTVEVDDSANIPAGTVLYVEALADADPAGGCGDLGTAVSGAIALNGTDTTAEDIVTAIGSGYTGRADGDDGVQLEYTLDVDGCDELYAASYTVNVTYTLTDSE